MESASRLRRRARDSDSVIETVVMLLLWRVALGYEVVTKLLGGNAEGFDAHVDAHLTAYDRGQTNLVGLVIGVMIAAIVVVNVAIPVINDALNNSNASGSTAIILGLIPLFLGLLLMVSVASPLMNRI
jgi:hypothetical protein